MNQPASSHNPAERLDAPLAARPILGVHESLIETHEVRSGEGIGIPEPALHALHDARRPPVVRIGDLHVLADDLLSGRRGKKLTPLHPAAQPTVAQRLAPDAPPTGAT